MYSRESLILIGPPGSGKSTVAGRLLEDKRIAAVETGNLLREEVDKQTAAGKQIKNNMTSGKIVPSDIVENIILNYLRNREESYILFDGFPRILEQVEIFFDISKELNIRLDAVVIFVMDDDTIKKRLLGRRICENCGTIYNIYFDPPDIEDKCSKCGGTLTTRKDDTPEIVDERIQHYKENTLKVAEYFKKYYPDDTIEIDALMDAGSVAEEIRKILVQ